MVSVVRPRKSIFSRPIFSMATMSKAVTISSFLVLCSGTNSISGRGEITTPAACTPEFRTRPSSFRAVSSNCRTCGSFWYASCSATDSLSASSSLIFSVVGTIFAMRSTSLYGISMARPTSLIAALAAMVPNVIICATFSFLYFRSQRSRHHLRDAVHIAVRHIHGAADILDRGFGRHGAERDNLRNIFPPVFMGDVFDHLTAPVHAEINIDIRHGNPLGIQEAFE